MASLAGLLRQIAASDDFQTILDAMMQSLSRWQPRLARIIALHSDPDGRLRMGQRLAEWQTGHAQPLHINDRIAQSQR